MNGKMPQPIPYQGSKRVLAEAILQHFPQSLNRLIEPFAGSGAFSIAVASNNRSNKFWLNDKNEPLIELLQLIINQPDYIIEKYTENWNNQLSDPKKYYSQIRDKFNETGKPEYLLYLLARCVKAAVRYNSKGQFNQSPDNRRLGRRPQSMALEIHTASALLKGKTQFSSKDYGKMIDDITEADFVYMDPPYQGTSGSRDQRYLSNVPVEEFICFIEKLVYKNIPFAISYDGTSGDKTYGIELPKKLGLQKVFLNAGISTQGTLNGKKVKTIESLYLSPKLIQLSRKEEHKIEQFSFAF